MFMHFPSQTANQNGQKAIMMKHEIHIPRLPRYGKNISGLLPMTIPNQLLYYYRTSKAPCSRALVPAFRESAPW
jgi:hypothetical protein